MVGLATVAALAIASFAGTTSARADVASAAGPQPVFISGNPNPKPLTQAQKDRVKAVAAKNGKITPIPTPNLPKSKLTTLEVSPQSVDVKPPDPPPTTWPVTPTLADTSSVDDPVRYAHQAYEVSNKNVGYCVDNFPFTGFVTAFEPVNHHFDCQMSEFGYYLADAIGIKYSQVMFKMASIYTAMDSATPSREFHVSHYMVGAEVAQGPGYNNDVLAYPLTLQMPCSAFTSSPSPGACYNISPGSGGFSATMQQWYDAATGVAGADPNLMPAKFYLYGQEGDGWAKSTINDGIVYYNPEIYLNGRELYGMTVRCDYSPATGLIMPTGCNMSGSDNVYQRPSLLPGDAFPEASQHTYDALYAPQTVWPGFRTLGGVIPGLKSFGQQLTRISNPDVNRNARKIGSGALCTDSRVPVTSSPGPKNCDEWPKAATKQGAASGGYLSLRKINADQNQAEGNAFGIWMAMNRILPETANSIDCTAAGKCSSVRNPVGDGFWVDVRR